VPGDASAEVTQALGPQDEGAVVAELVAYRGDQEVARDCAWPEPYRFHDFAPADLRVALQGNHLALQVARPLKGLCLEAAGTRFGDNFIDLMPGPARLVAFDVLPAQGVRLRALGCGVQEWTPPGSGHVHEPARTPRVPQEPGRFLHGGMGTTHSS